MHEYWISWNDNSNHILQIQVDSVIKVTPGPIKGDFNIKSIKMQSQNALKCMGDLKCFFYACRMNKARFKNVEFNPLSAMKAQ